MSVNVPLHKWRSADPVILIGRRCIARTDQDVINEQSKLFGAKAASVRP